MRSLRFYSRFLVFGIVLLACGIVAPVLAAGGEVTVGYQGAGWYYVGDTIIFNGMNSVGNNTLIKITGPGLPAGGVPPYSLSGTEGSGNPAKFLEGKTWSFTWDTTRVDPSKLSSGRHTVTVWDAENPGITSSVSITLKQPEFYLKASPSTARLGDYITLNGMAEKGVSYVKINVTDASGKVLHTFMSPVSASGSFSYSFHADMAPGQYTVTGTNPAMTNILRLTLTISEPTANLTMTSTAVTTAPATLETTTTPASVGTAAETTVQESGTTPAASATKAGIGMATPVLALALFGAGAILWARKKY